MSDENIPTPPTLRIVRGNPDDAEIAALTAAIAGVAAAKTTGEPPRRRPWSVWNDRAAAMHHPAGRQPLRPGPSAWRTSALPR